VSAGWQILGWNRERRIDAGRREIARAKQGQQPGGRLPISRQTLNGTEIGQARRDVVLDCRDPDCRPGAACLPGIRASRKVYAEIHPLSIIGPISRFGRARLGSKEGTLPAHGRAILRDARWLLTSQLHLMCSFAPFAAVQASSIARKKRQAAGASEHAAATDSVDGLISFVPAMRAFKSRMRVSSSTPAHSASPLHVPELRHAAQDALQIGASGRGLQRGGRAPGRSEDAGPAQQGAASDCGHRGVSLPNALV
jgi:hypothetical protein